MKKIMQIRYQDEDEALPTVAELADLHDDLAKAEKLKEFFREQATSHPRLNPKDYDGEDIIVEPSEVELIFEKMTTKGQHLDDPPFKIIRKCRASVSRIWTKLFNQIFEDMAIPKRWKIERVTQIPKCPEPPSMKKLRNITMLLLIDKVFERVVQNRILSTASFPRHQFGFQEDASIDDCIVSLRDSVLGHFDRHTDGQSCQLHGHCGGLHNHKT